MEDKTIKEHFKMILTRESKVLLNTFLTSRNLGIAIILWVSISIVGSLYRRAFNKCDNVVQLDKYFSAKLLCEVGRESVHW